MAVNTGMGNTNNCLSKLLGINQELIWKKNYSSSLSIAKVSVLTLTKRLKALKNIKGPPGLPTCT